MLACACTYTHKHSVPPQFSFFHSRLAMSLVLLFHFLCVQSKTLYTLWRETIFQQENLFNFEISGARFPHSHGGKGSATQFLGSMLGDFQGSVRIRCRISCRKARYPNRPLGMNTFFEWNVHAKIIKRIFGRQSQAQNLCFWLGVPWRCWYSDTPTFNAGRDIGPIWHLSCIFGLIEVNFDSRCHKSPNSSWMSRNECLNG